MANLFPQFVLLAVVTTGVGVAMSHLGIQHGLLEARRERRRCSSCGRVLHERACRNCTQP